jgi:hypothetical protein
MVFVVFSPLVSATDTDGDGIDDSIDICKWAAGTANSTLGMGCPDRDGDGLADFEEEIKHNWGESEREAYDYNDPVGDEPRAIEWAANGSMYYAGGEDNIVVMFDSLGNNMGVLHQMPGDITEIQRSPDGTMLAISSGNGGAHVINSTSGTLITNLTANAGTMINSSSTVSSLTWSNDQSRIFFHNGTTAIVWFNTTTWTQERHIPGFIDYQGSSWMGAMDTTPDDSLIIFSALGEIHAYWVENATYAWNNTSHTDYIRALRVSPDGRYMVSGGDMEIMFVHSIDNGPVLVHTGLISDEIHDIEFSTDGGSVFVAVRGSDDGIRVFDTDGWSSLGVIDGFGSSNRNRGTEGLAINPDGDRLVVGHRRSGRMSLHIAAEGHLRVHGEMATQLMESRWRDWYPTNSESVRTWDVDRATTTSEICAGKSYIGSHPAGVSPLYATKNSSFSSNGLWDCTNTEDQILDVPYGRMAAAMFVKSGGETESCIATQGGLSMGQLRWITSDMSKNALQQNSEMPGINMASIAPNDDGDSIPEWKDLDSSCSNSPIVLAHRWENRTEPWVVKDKLLCENCNNPDTFYGVTPDRYRAIVGGERDDVLLGVAASSGEGSIGFTELGYSLTNGTGVYLIPLVDNYTHGAADAISEGGVAVTPSLNASRDDTWPLQTNQRMFMNTNSLGKNINFARFLVSDVGAMQWEDLSFTRLGIWDTYLSYRLLGVNVSYLLPDQDSDGVWDGIDICANTDLGLPVNSDGCADNQLDNDNDGYTNDLDDCDDDYGTSTLGSLGCPDSDGDNWADDFDSHPGDSSEWNDTDSDGYGDNSDHCIYEWGNSTNDTIGCPDTDGDGWSDSGDAFVNDSSEWSDIDGDGIGDNTDAFPYENTQWSDGDGDGYGDNITGIEGDTCASTWGTSNKNGIFGCVDRDGDGWADTDDDLPDNPLQHTDVDGDGVGDDASIEDYDWCTDTTEDELSLVDSKGCGPSQRDSDYDTIMDNADQCPNTHISQSANVNSDGCSPSEIDLDGDGFSSAIDWDDQDPEQHSDSDGDGYGDNGNVAGGDSCPVEEGTSNKDKFGCPDLDGDGWSNDGDALPFDQTQWADTDSDGFYDNWDDPSWNESRTVGEFVLGATNPDRCPEQYSNFADYEGCLTAKVVENENSESGQDESDSEGGLDLLTIIGMIAGGIILCLIGAITVLMNKKKPQIKEDKVNAAFDEIKDESDNEDVEPINYVPTWEELPPGEWLPTDENGTNWYLDSEGKHWYSDTDGYHVWEE